MSFPITFTSSLLTALIALLCALPAQANDTSPDAPQEAIAPPAEANTPPSTGTPRASRKNRKNANSEAEIKELLALIPEHHPMREELRQIVLIGPPAGFTARQWLELSMKVDFRSAMTKGGANKNAQNDF